MQLYRFTTLVVVSSGLKNMNNRTIPPHCWNFDVEHSHCRRYQAGEVCLAIQLSSSHLPAVLQPSCSWPTLCFCLTGVMQLLSCCYPAAVFLQSCCLLTSLHSCLASVCLKSCSHLVALFCFCLVVILLLSCSCITALSYFFLGAVLLLSYRCLISFFLLLCCSALLLSGSCIFLIMSYCSHTGFIWNFQYDIPLLYIDAMTKRPWSLRPRLFKTSLDHYVPS
jgi:hypothetical protein